MALFNEFIFGRQAAWRPGAFGLVSSHWLVALFKEIILGRQAAWRPGAFMLVSSHWMVALFKEIKLGRQAAWRPGCKWDGVVKLVGVAPRRFNEVKNLLFRQVYP